MLFFLSSFFCVLGVSLTSFQLNPQRMIIENEERSDIKTMSDLLKHKFFFLNHYSIYMYSIIKTIVYYFLYEKITWKWI